MDTPTATLFFLKTHQKMVKLFRYALWWVLIGGVPRTIFYTSFEWANAADKLQVPALMVKHVLIVTPGGLGGDCLAAAETEGRTSARLAPGRDAGRSG